MIALIDGDVVAYMAAFAAQRNVYYVDSFNDGEIAFESEFVSHEEAENYIEHLQEKAEYKFFTHGIRTAPYPAPPKVAEDCAYTLLKRILGDVHAVTYKIYLTSDDKSNFRIALAQTNPYKGNRKLAKPVHLAAVRQYLIDTWDAEVIYGQEADDALGIAQMKNNADHLTQHKTVICTVDKDLLMIPGYHYNFRNPEIKLILPTEAMRFFWKQMLMGDSVDNVPGVPKIGKARANKLVDNQKTLKACQEIVWQEYLKAYKEEAEKKYFEMGNLLWIKREQDKIFQDYKFTDA